MGNADPPSRLELPHRSTDNFPGTPSELTPNTRSEAEAALTLNSTIQTESAAPTTPLPTNNIMALDGTKDHEEDMTEAQKAWRRPAGLNRTSSMNYATALAEAQKEPTLQFVLSSYSVTESGRNITDADTVASPTSTTTSTFPPLGQGVVPLHTGVGAGQAQAINRAKPSGLSLGTLARQQSWNAQDLKHVYSANLMEPVKSDAGYASGAEGNGP